jgi:hypothetical protein
MTASVSALNGESSRAGLIAHPMCSVPYLGPTRDVEGYRLPVEDALKKYAQTLYHIQFIYFMGRRDRFYKVNGVACRHDGQPKVHCDSQIPNLMESASINLLCTVQGCDLQV